MLNDFFFHQGPTVFVHIVWYYHVVIGQSFMAGIGSITCTNKPKQNTSNMCIFGDTFSHKLQLLLKRMGRLKIAFHRYPVDNNGGHCLTTFKWSTKRLVNSSSIYISKVLCLTLGTLMIHTSTILQGKHEYFGLNFLWRRLQRTSSVYPVCVWLRTELLNGICTRMMCLIALSLKA